MKTKSKVLNREFDFKATSKGLSYDPIHNYWMFTKWDVYINGIHIEYKTGIGHLSPLNNYYKDDFIALIGKNIKKDEKSTKLYLDRLSGCSRPKPLNIDDVLYSCVMDSQAVNQNFYDWVDDSGYDKDSIIAQKIYDDCVKIGLKLRRIIDLDEANELFQNY